MNEKYEMIENDTKKFNGHTLYRIRAKLDIGDDVKKGDLGGYIEKEENLNVSGNAWVSGDAQVFGDAWVYGDAWVSGDAEIRKSYDYVVIGPIGSRSDFTTFFWSKNGIFVNCGCFFGMIGEFEKRVAKVHAGTRHYEAYNAAIAMAKEILKERDEK